jgi:two-component sensor histidine kinase
MSAPVKQLLSLQISFGAAPPQTLVTPLCQSLVEMCRATLDDDAASRLRLTAHELLENISKYSADQACELRFALHRAEDGALFASVETRNVPPADNLLDADERLAALCSASDPRAHYDTVIANSALQPAGSGLGLARIHAETEYRITHRVEDEQLVIVASGEVWSKRSALP